MKTFFVETRKKFEDSEIQLDLLDKIPGKTIALAATIQYIDLIPRVKKYLESINKKVILKQGAYYKGHVLGCNSAALDKSADTFLIITDGIFHAINNAIQIQKPIYIFTTTKLDKITQQQIEEHNKKTTTKQKKFLSSKKVGLLVSLKQGQHQKAIQNIKKKIEKLNKNVYIFETNNIDTNEFENFPQIQMWINTACFGLARDDMRIINMTDILEFIS